MVLARLSPRLCLFVCSFLPRNDWTEYSRQSIWHRSSFSFPTAFFVPCSPQLCLLKWTKHDRIPTGFLLGYDPSRRFVCPPVLSIHDALFSALCVRRKLVATWATRVSVSRIGVAAVRHHLGIPYYSGSEASPVWWWNWWLQTSALISSISYNCCFSHTAYHVRVKSWEMQKS